VGYRLGRLSLPAARKDIVDVELMGYSVYGCKFSSYQLIAAAWRASGETMSANANGPYVIKKPKKGCPDCQMECVVGVVNVEWHWTSLFGILGTNVTLTSNIEITVCADGTSTVTPKNSYTTSGCHYLVAVGLRTNLGLHQQAFQHRPTGITNPRRHRSPLSLYHRIQIGVAKEGQSNAHCIDGGRHLLDGLRACD